MLDLSQTKMPMDTLTPETLLTDPNWEDSNDTDGNGFVDDLIGWDFHDNDPAHEEGLGHGTAMAGTIGAIGDNGVGVAGINWKVQMMPTRIRHTNATDVANAVAGFNYAVDSGASVSANSWGDTTSFSQAAYDAIDAARLSDHLFIAAAGNKSSDNDVQPKYPGSYDLDNIITVAAVDETNELASFSNFGLTSVDLAAISSANASTAPPPDNYGNTNGTSSARSHVTGFAALLRSLQPEWTYSQIKT
jgi:hypothetical protein